jgi:hypothetical protein
MAGYLVSAIGTTLQYLTDQGVVLSGGQVFTYVAGSVSTPLTTYTDNTLGTANANPIVLTSAGRLPASCWVPAGTPVKLVLEDANNNVIANGTIDELPAINDPGVIINYGLTAFGGTSTNSGNNYSVTTTLPFTAYANGVSVEFFVNATNTGAVTLNLNSLGAKTVVNADGSTILSGTWILGQPVSVVYNGGQFYQTVPSNTRDIPQNIQNATYTTVLLDDGKHIYHSDGNAYTWTIAANASVAYNLGATLTFVNDASAAVNITIAIASDTLVWIPTGGTGSRTLAQYGRATALKVASTRWWLSGVGLT